MFCSNMLYLIPDTRRFVKGNTHIATCHVYFVVGCEMQSRYVVIDVYVYVCMRLYPDLEDFFAQQLRILTMRDGVNSKIDWKSKARIAYQSATIIFILIFFAQITSHSLCLLACSCETRAAVVNFPNAFAFSCCFYYTNRKRSPE